MGKEDHQLKGTIMKTAMEQAMQNLQDQAQQEANTKRNALITYWQYYGDADQRMVADYVKELEAKVKTYEQQ